MSNVTEADLIAETGWAYSDPSDFTEAEAAARAEAEMPDNADSHVARTKGLDSTDSRREFFERRGLNPPISFGELRKKSVTVDFIIENALVDKQSCIIAGASKSMKTSISLNLSIALASGFDFLSRFKVNQRKKVLLCSAESGESTIQRNLIGMSKSMSRSMGADESLLDSLLDETLSCQWWVPKLSNADMLAYFCDCLDVTGAEVAILDPMYQMLSGENSSNLSLNAEQIQTFVLACLERGVTPVINDHVKRGSQAAKEHKPISLDDVTGAGKAENVRQWMLISRRSQFQPDATLDKRHDLWLSIGGSAGFSSTWGLDILEKFTCDYSEVDYEFETSDPQEVSTSRIAADKESAFEKRDAQKEKSLESKCEKIMNELRSKPDTLLTVSDVKAICSCDSDKAREVIYRLQSTGRIQKNPQLVRRGKNNCECWQLPGPTLLPLENYAGDAGQRGRDEKTNQSRVPASHVNHPGTKEGDAPM